MDFTLFSGCDPLIWMKTARGYTVPVLIIQTPDGSPQSEIEARRYEALVRSTSGSAGPPATEPERLARVYVSQRIARAFFDEEAAAFQRLLHPADPLLSAIRYMDTIAMALPASNTENNAEEAAAIAHHEGGHLVLAERGWIPSARQPEHMRHENECAAWEAAELAEPSACQSAHWQKARTIGLLSHGISKFERVLTPPWRKQVEAHAPVRFFR